MSDEDPYIDPYITDFDETFNDPDFQEEMASKLTNEVSDSMYQRALALFATPGTTTAVSSMRAGKSFTMNKLKEIWDNGVWESFATPKYDPTIIYKRETPVYMNMGTQFQISHPSPLLTINPQIDSSDSSDAIALALVREDIANANIGLSNPVVTHLTKKESPELDVALLMGNERAIEL